jgi:hypothetical protein
VLQRGASVGDHLPAERALEVVDRVAVEIDEVGRRGDASKTTAPTYEQGTRFSTFVLNAAGPPMSVMCGGCKRLISLTTTGGTHSVGTT